MTQASTSPDAGLLVELLGAGLDRRIMNVLVGAPSAGYLPTIADEIAELQAAQEQYFTIDHELTDARGTLEEARRRDQAALLAANPGETIDDDAYHREARQRLRRLRAQHPGATRRLHHARLRLAEVAADDDADRQALAERVDELQAMREPLARAVAHIDRELTRVAVAREWLERPGNYRQGRDWVPGGDSSAPAELSALADLSTRARRALGMG